MRYYFGQFYRKGSELGARTLLVLIVALNVKWIVPSAYSTEPTVGELLGSCRVETLISPRRSNTVVDLVTCSGQQRIVVITTSRHVRKGIPQGVLVAIALTASTSDCGESCEDLEELILTLIAECKEYIEDEVLRSSFHHSESIRFELYNTLNEQTVHEDRTASAGLVLEGLLTSLTLRGVLRVHVRGIDPS